MKNEGWLLNTLTVLIVVLSVVALAAIVVAVL